MAQYDVHANPTGVGFLLNCQSELIGGLSHVLMVPLLPEANAPLPARKLNPIFDWGSGRVVMMTQFSSAVPKRKLGIAVASLDHHHFEITAALDLLLHGF